MRGEGTPSLLPVSTASFVVAGMAPPVASGDEKPLSPFCFPFPQKRSQGSEGLLSPLLPRDSRRTASRLPPLRAFSLCVLPAAREDTQDTPPLFPCSTSPTAPGDLQDAAACRATPSVHPSEKSALGGGWGPGRRRAPCAPAKGPSFPQMAAPPPSCPHLRKQQRIFIIMCWPGDRMADSHAPRPGAENARHDARARVPLLAQKGAGHAGKRCPRACQGPFFTISPLQPSSRGYYELYQGRCLEISCGAPPR